MYRGKDKIEYAIYFANKAHKDQKRKVENVNMIFHPFTVGMILQRNGCDEDVVAAGILHDVVEDTDATNEDLKNDIELTEMICSLPKGKKEFLKNILPFIENFDPDDK